MTADHDWRPDARTTASRCANCKASRWASGSRYMCRGFRCVVWRDEAPACVARVVDRG